MATQDQTTVDGTGFSTLEAAVVGLLTLTGVFHLYAGIVEGAPPVLLAGLGFFGGVGLYLWGWRRQLLTVAAIPFTAIQIPLWYVVKAGNFTPVGYADKFTQVVAIAVLIILAFRR
ncbi:MAG: hypothetical protein J07HB67_00126 [halophilic archaeon J07HB67]|nr:MAG: hypothetical protein J07HB67_00126 [halophilic archaeon J07HB67]